MSEPRRANQGQNALSDAWQAALAAEQQAAFGYALLGPRLSAKEQDLARSCQAAHDDTRDQTADAIAASGAAPTAPRGDYPALYPLAQAPRILAAELEDECAAAWRYLYGEAAQSRNAAAIRKQAQRALTASAVRATRWRVLAQSTHPVVAFPGA